MTQTLPPYHSEADKKYLGIYFVNERDEVCEYLVSEFEAFMFLQTHAGKGARVLHNKWLQFKVELST